MWPLYLFTTIWYSFFHFRYIYFVIPQMGQLNRKYIKTNKFWMPSWSCYITYLSQFANLVYSLVKFTEFYFDQQIVDSSYFLTYFWYSILFPLTTLVLLLYWSLYLISPTLVQNSVSIETSYFWSIFIKHAMHSVPWIFLVATKLIDISNQSSQDLDFFVVLKISFLMTILLNIWMFLVKKNSGSWTYPILNVLWNSRFHWKYVVFSVGLLLVVQILACLGLFVF